MKELNCEKCEKTFSLRWRLKKHQESHDKANARFCHYFNNEKICPYEEIGCMYIHEKSDPCRFQTFCQNKLCQFQHSVNLVYGSKERENFDCTEVVDGEFQSETQINEKIEQSENDIMQDGMKKVYEKYIVCSDCDFVCTNESDLKLHISLTHVKKPIEMNLRKRKMMKR